ncbi:MAG: major facilitator superfamily 1 [Myxococcales bacterium]|nr:major facilitator superfamily 1 [Myxococcales bacterium]
MPTARSHRWIIAAAATLMQVALGAVYAWSVFRKPLAASLGASVAEVNLTFTTTILMLGFAAFIGGLWITKVGPRVIGITSGALYGLGVYLAGFAEHSLPLLYVTYGAIAGFGIGLGYIVPLATLVKWFPDKRGMITGIAVAGFGAGALAFGPLARVLIRAYGPFNTFHVFGAIFFLVIVNASSWMRDPPAGYRPAGFRPRPSTTSVNKVDHELGAALRTWQWYALWVVLFLNVSAGISIIAEAAPMAQEIGGATEVQATALVGTIAIFNGAGRFAWAALSDLIGRRAVFTVLFLAQAVVFLLLPFATSYEAFLALACVSLLCYGGAFGTMPAFVADYFGPRTVGKVYGLMLTAWGAGAILGPVLVSRIHDGTGHYTGGLRAIAVIMLFGSIVPMLLRTPRPLMSRSAARTR